ncbi:fasciclin-like arabinogalactan protein [Colletotrichum spaethianum]|uniref:Fasciclin-like arabinogalactan protein n=1 Tax=Colletotrichum spaethianum TaxID=700344 RepID=A0AA37P871_9PEZI|nr:fasciclin-like arabinogalactan protein [Colletotrichum spaethianum]GKT47434.1 fasciclin-like arabinogalactan protein [Colletotrichum spaethianum]
MRLPFIITGIMLLGHASAASLSQVLGNHGSLSMLHNLLKELDLLDRFEAVEGSTFLAMTNDALIYLANWGLNMSTIDPSLSKSILKYHFLEGVYPSTDPSLKTDTQIVHSVLRPPILTNVTAGPVVKLRMGKDGIFCAESGIQKVLHVNDSDINHDNGVLHTIDSNLVLPHNLSETTKLGNLQEFWNIIEKSGTKELLEPLQDVTIFLPNNNAVKQRLPLLDALTAEQLSILVANHAIMNHVLYHTTITDEEMELETLGGMKVVVKHDSKGDIFVNAAKVVTKDVLIFGGVAHIVDDVLVPSTGRL